MPEPLPMRLQALHEDVDDMRPGDFRWADGQNGVRHLLLCIPTGDVVSIPGDRWVITGPDDRPTVSPSIWHNKGRACPDAGEWHGFVRDGVMVDA